MSTAMRNSRVTAARTTSKQPVRNPSRERVPANSRVPQRRNPFGSGATQSVVQKVQQSNISASNARSSNIAPSRTGPAKPAEPVTRSTKHSYTTTFTKNDPFENKRSGMTNSNSQSRTSNGIYDIRQGSQADKTTNGSKLGTTTTSMSRTQLSSNNSTPLNRTVPPSKPQELDVGKQSVTPVRPTDAMRTAQTQSRVQYGTQGTSEGKQSVDINKLGYSQTYDPKRYIEETKTSTQSGVSRTSASITSSTEPVWSTTSSKPTPSTQIAQREEKSSYDPSPQLAKTENSFTNSRVVSRRPSREQISPAKPTYEAGRYTNGFSSTSSLKKHSLVGLRNLGNTWFMNSILQCIAHIPEMQEKWFLSNDYKRDISSRSKLNGELAKAFADLMRDLLTSSSSDVAPNSLKYWVGRRASQFSGYGQQDSMELCRFLLDGLNEDLNRAGKSTYKELSGEGEPQEVIEDWWQYNNSRESSIITDYFRGQLLSTITCATWKHKNYAADTFLDLPLPIPGRTQTTLQQCFESFVEVEQIDDYRWSKCKKSRVCTKQMSICKWPKVLVLQLKRFSYSTFRRSKLSTNVNFPVDRLDLSEFQWPAGSGSVTYELWGISHHMGDLGFGHYIADCKSNGSWYCFDDSRVSSISAPGSKSSAYVLFYSRTN